MKNRFEDQSHIQKSDEEMEKHKSKNNHSIKNLIDDYKERKETIIKIQMNKLQNIISEMQKKKFFVIKNNEVSIPTNKELIIQQNIHKLANITINKKKHEETALAYQKYFKLDDFTTEKLIKLFNTPVLGFLEEEKLHNEIRKLIDQKKGKIFFSHEL